jgi:hypothetical protein
MENWALVDKCLSRIARPVITDNGLYIRRGLFI